MKCPPKVLCLTFGGHFIMTKGSIYFFELPPKIPFLPVWYCFSDEVPHILCSAFPQIQKKIPDSANGLLHAYCCIHFLGYAEERTYTQELGQHNVVDEYSGDKYQYIFHILPCFMLYAVY